jgi:hypothetical protein
MMRVNFSACKNGVAQRQLAFSEWAWALGGTSRFAHAHQSPRRFVGMARQNQFGRESELKACSTSSVTGPMPLTTTTPVIHVARSTSLSTGIGATYL